MRFAIALMPIGQERHWTLPTIQPSLSQCTCDRLRSPTHISWHKKRQTSLGSGADCSDSRAKPWERRNSTAASANATAAAALVAQQPQGALPTATARIERHSREAKTNGKLGRGQDGCVRNERRFGGTVGCGAKGVARNTTEQSAPQSAEMHSVLARYMNSEASTIGWSGSMGKLHANFCRRTLSRVFRV